MNKKQLQSSLLLLVTALIWGTAFVAQSVAMDYIEPFTFNAIRFLLGGTVLLPVIAVGTKKMRKAEKGTGTDRSEKKLLWKGGIICGVALCVASALQQFGIQGTTVGKTGFVTALYIVLVPVFGVFLHKKAGIKLWISVLVAIFGLYLLCMKAESFSVNHYDVILLFCAAAFAVQILYVDYFSPKLDAVKLSCIQFYVCGLLSLVMMLLTEHPDPGAILVAWKPVLYTGVMSCGVAYTLQVVGQKNLNPVIASLIMSLEAVISAIAGWVILGQHLSRREIAGCVVMFAAILLAQLPTGSRE